MVPFCFVLDVLVEYIPHVVDCFPCWLHCLVTSFVNDYLKQVILSFGTFSSIFSMGSIHGSIHGSILFLLPAIFEISFIS